MNNSEINLYSAFSQFIKGMRDLVPSILYEDNDQNIWEAKYLKTLMPQQKRDWGKSLNNIDDPKYLIDFGNLRSFILNKLQFLGARYNNGNIHELPTMFAQMNRARNSLMHFAPFNEEKAALAYLQMINVAVYFEMNELASTLRELREASINAKYYSGEKKVSSISKKHSRNNTLPIELNPPDVDEFKRLLLISKEAYITTYYINDDPKTKLWNANRFTETSDVLGNLRSRPNFRNSSWKNQGIQRVYVSIENKSQK